MNGLLGLDSVVPQLLVLEQKKNFSRLGVKHHCGYCMRKALKQSIIWVAVEEIVHHACYKKKQICAFSDRISTRRGSGRGVEACQIAYENCAVSGHPVPFLSDEGLNYIKNSWLILRVSVCCFKVIFWQIMKCFRCFQLVIIVGLSFLASQVDRRKRFYYILPEQILCNRDVCTIDCTFSLSGGVVCISLELVDSITLKFFFCFNLNFRQRVIEVPVSIVPRQSYALQLHWLKLPNMQPQIELT